MPPSPSIRARLKGEIPVYLAALIGLATCLALWRAYGVSFGFGGAKTSAQMLLASMAVMGLPLLVQGLRRDRPASPLAWLAERARHGPVGPRIMSALPLLLICVFIVPVFSTLKSMIPLFTDYTWDATFIAWDRALFFGADPWRVLHPLLGYPQVTAAIAVTYHLWMLLLYPGVLYFAFAGRVGEEVRRRFFLAYLMGWFLIGGALATAMASVGPVFLEPLLGNATFAPLAAYLVAADAEVSVMVVDVQRLLLERFAQDARGLGSGITAMPSMHIAICVLYWLAARRLSRRAGLFFGAFAVLIWIGSIHTGYHYAVDGIVSLIAMTAIWWLSGAIVRAWDGLLERRAQPVLRTNTVPTE